MEHADLIGDAVIFDVYGTLLEVGPPPPEADARWQRLWREGLRIEPRLSRLEFGVRASEVIARHHAAARARGIPWPEVDWLAVVIEVMPELAARTAPERDDFLLRQIQTGHSTRLGAEAATVLRGLKARGCLLGIASNAQAYTVRELQEGLASQGLGLDLFEPDLCFWSYTHGFSKPDPHVFQLLSARLGLRGILPERALIVGDRKDHDIEPARAHGWRTWHLTNGAEEAASGSWPALARRLAPSGSAPGIQSTKAPAQSH